MLFLNTILDIIFPVKCLSCGYAGVDLCLVCTSNFPPAERENAKWVFLFLIIATHRSKKPCGS